MRKGERTVTIGGGILRGRVLRYPSDDRLRPSMQRTKSSVFSSLAPWLEGAVFVDLYAGAGAVGIEALSRGAAFVHFVERDRVALDALRENLKRCGIEASRFRVHAATVAEMLVTRPHPIPDAKIVFADPPYDADVNDDLIGRFDALSMPALSWLVIEHRTRVVIEAPRGMSLQRDRQFGETTLSYFQK